MQNYRIKDDNIVFKVIMLGAQGVGKSSMLIRYIKGSFQQDYEMTVGVQFATKLIKLQQGIQVKLQIWDTAGLQSFKSVVRSFYKGISAVFLSFQITKQKTLTSLDLWINQIKQYGHQDIVLFLIGTKCDLDKQRKVNMDTALEYLKKIGAVYYVETSAKTGTGIQQLFKQSAQFMYKKYMTSSSYRSLVAPVTASMITPNFRTESFNISDKDFKQNKKCCG